MSLIFAYKLFTYLFWNKKSPSIKIVLYKILQIKNDSKDIKFEKGTGYLPTYPSLVISCRIVTAKSKHNPAYLSSWYFFH